MSTSAGPRRPYPLAPRLLIAIARAVPLLFTVALAGLGTAWLAAGRTGPGLAILAAGAGAAIFGIRIALASRV